MIDFDITPEMITTVYWLIGVITGILIGGLISIMDEAIFLLGRKRRKILDKKKSKE